MQLNLGAPDRKIDGIHPEDDHRLWGNILQGFERYIVLPSATSQSEGNVFSGVSGSATDLFHAGPQTAADLAAWQGGGRDRSGVELPLQVSFDTETMELRVTAAEGARKHCKAVCYIVISPFMRVTVATSPP
mgnify:CR=1 FL=1